MRFVFEMNAPEVAKVSMVGDVVGCRKVAAGGVHAHVVESTHSASRSLVVPVLGLGQAVKEAARGAEHRLAATHRLPARRRRREQ